MNKFSLKNYNFILVFCIVALNVIGILAIRSASGSGSSLVIRQIEGVCAGIVVMGIISFVDYRKILKLSVIIYIACCALLIMVLVVGLVRGGAKRWVTLPVIGQLQPSEFVKVGIVITLAAYLGRTEDDVQRFSEIFVAIVLSAIPLLLILLEPDLSTTIIIGVSVIAMIYVSGISYKAIGIISAVIIPFFAAVIVLIKNGKLALPAEYQSNRIMAFFDRTAYTDANLQQNNSIMAIASGKLWGKGFNNNSLESIKNGNFLSEQKTDFIFAVVGEETGFIGCLVVLLLYTILVFECYRMARRAADMSGKVICTGIGALIGFQAFTNIAVATGVFPNTGLPLPFISYGVSSLLSMYIAMGLVLNVGLTRDRTVNRRFI